MSGQSSDDPFSVFAEAAVEFANRDLAMKTADNVIIGDASPECRTHATPRRRPELAVIGARFPGMDMDFGHGPGRGVIAINYPEEIDIIGHHIETGRAHGRRTLVRDIVQHYDTIIGRSGLELCPMREFVITRAFDDFNDIYHPKDEYFWQHGTWRKPGIQLPRKGLSMSQRKAARKKNKLSKKARRAAR